MTRLVEERMSKREKNKSQNRLRLIHSAVEAFAAQGLKGANINLISTGAGLGKGTVYNYFPSKEELFAVVIDWAGAQLVPEIKKAQPSEGAIDRRLKGLISALLGFYRERPELAKMLIRCVSAHRVEHQRAILAAFEPFLARLQDVLSAGIERRELRPDLDPFLSAVTLWGMVNHQAAFHWLVSTRPLDPDGVAELVLAYFLAGIRLS